MKIDLLNNIIIILYFEHHNVCFVATRIVNNHYSMKGSLYSLFYLKNLTKTKTLVVYRIPDRYLSTFVIRY